MLPRKVRRELPKLIEETRQLELRRKEEEREADPVSHDPQVPTIYTIAEAGDLHKADGISAMRVKYCSDVTDFIVLMHGHSVPQNKAIANAIEDAMARKHGIEAKRRDGSVDGGWLVLDYGSILVNIMTPKKREYYNMEGHWRKQGSEPVPLAHVLRSDVREGYSTGRDVTYGGGNRQQPWEEEEVDPFWS
ncbi:unnamed protein product [Vitrella brassicaformis CCMP3155]|uniref:Ribosomal silencing factor RsfS n=2 Tax=Vitrella brassicaformis TaxID=1169539 RepID=A0A0G4GME8_VITBC|nr:unnamed protein product [Vitrella brassicaformis CCMP3155]|eukprot:CEM31303.1 unnamed protein product [Vitrella brassicaformis CCMP3155]